MLRLPCKVKNLKVNEIFGKIAICKILLRVKSVWSKCVIGTSVLETILSPSFWEFDVKIIPRGDRLTVKKINEVIAK